MHTSSCWSSHRWCLLLQHQVIGRLSSLPSCLSKQIWIAVSCMMARKWGLICLTSLIAELTSEFSIFYKPWWTRWWCRIHLNCNCTWQSIDFAFLASTNHFPSERTMKNGARYYLAALFSTPVGTHRPDIGEVLKRLNFVQSGLRQTSI